MSRACKFATLIAALLPLATQAKDDLPGLAFSHHDWEIVCDNTRTCRAAGYHDDSEKLTVSVLLTRKAGPGQEVTGELMIGDYGNEGLSDLPPVLKLTMRVNEKNLGLVVTEKDSMVGKLSATQVSALLGALSHKSKIRWSTGKYTWTLSDKGAAAVLLKMDEFQGRIGTQGAIIKKGPLSDDTALPALPEQRVSMSPLAKTLPGDAAVGRHKALRKALNTALGKDDYCPDLTDSSVTQEITITRLTDSKLLASTQCWTGAYNAGYGYWVIDAKPPFHPVLVTDSAGD